jgi:hypothetical protein
MADEPERPRLRPYLIFGIIAATIEMAAILWLLYR